jgi:hypothetical protein
MRPGESCASMADSHRSPIGKPQINVGQVGNLRTDWQSVPASQARLLQ